MWPNSLLQCELPTTHPSVTYAYIKFMWHNSQKDDAVQHLYRLIDHLEADSGAGANGSSPEHHELLARCYHKLGQWRAKPFLESAGQMSSDITDEDINSIIELFHLATTHNDGWYKVIQMIQFCFIMRFNVMNVRDVHSSF